MTNWHSGAPSYMSVRVFRVRAQELNNPQQKVDDEAKVEQYTKEIQTHEVL